MATVVAPAGAVVITLKLLPSVDSSMEKTVAVLGFGVVSLQASLIDDPERAVADRLGWLGTAVGGFSRPYITRLSLVPTNTSPLATVGTANLTPDPRLSPPPAA